MTETVNDYVDWSGDFAGELSDAVKRELDLDEDVAVQRVSLHIEVENDESYVLAEYERVGETSI